MSDKVMTDYGRVRGGGHYSSTSNGETVIPKTTIIGNTYPLVGDTIINANSDMLEVTAMTDTEYTVRKYGSLKGDTGATGATGLGVRSIENGTPVVGDGKTETPVVVTYTDGKADSFIVAAQNGQDPRLDSILSGSAVPQSTNAIRLQDVDVSLPNTSATFGDYVIERKRLLWEGEKQIKVDYETVFSVSDIASGYPENFLSKTLEFWFGTSLTTVKHITRFRFDGMFNSTSYSMLVFGGYGGEPALYANQVLIRLQYPESEIIEMSFMQYRIEHNVMLTGMTKDAPRLYKIYLIE